MPNFYLPQYIPLSSNFRQYVPSQRFLFDRSSIAKLKISHSANVVCDGSPSLTDQDSQQTLPQILDIVHANFGSRESICRELEKAGLSETLWNQLSRQHLGMTANIYLRHYRLDMACRMHPSGIPEKLSPQPHVIFQLVLLAAVSTPFTAFPPARQQGPISFGIGPCYLFRSFSDKIGFSGLRTPDALAPPDDKMPARLRSPPQHPVPADFNRSAMTGGRNGAGCSPQKVSTCVIPYS